MTGIDLPNEAQDARVDSQKVVDNEHAQDPKDFPNDFWGTGSNLELAFGQGGTVITPIEQAVAYATFANGGTRYVPEVAAGIVNAQGKVVRAVAPKVAGHVSYSPADYQALLQGFEGVVQNPKGTAVGAFTGFPLSSFPLAGKTGHRHHQRAAAQLLVRGLGTAARPPVPHRGGGPGRRVRGPGRRTRGPAGVRLSRGPSRDPDPARPAGLRGGGGAHPSSAGHHHHRPRGASGHHHRDTLEDRLEEGERPGPGPAPTPAGTALDSSAT